MPTHPSTIYLPSASKTTFPLLKWWINHIVMMVWWSTYCYAARTLLICNIVNPLPPEPRDALSKNPSLSAVLEHRRVYVPLNRTRTLIMLTSTPLNSHRGETGFSSTALSYLPYTCGVTQETSPIHPVGDRHSPGGAIGRIGLEKLMPMVYDT